jgi:hypothetical protein
MRSRDERGSLALAMLFILVAGTLSALLVPVGVTHLKASRTISERTHALHAAQTGIDVMVGRIRAAVNGSGSGVAALLPGPELTGSVGANGTGRYRVTVTYRDANHNVVAVVGVATPPQPSTATLVSTGVDSATANPVPGVAGSRTLQATYRFRTTNDNIPGGMIPVNGKSTVAGTLCIAATSPVVSGVVRAEPCTQGDPAARRFAYTEELTLRLVGSESVTPRGLCLQGAGDPTSGTYAHAVDQKIVLQPCAEVTATHSKTLIAQQWSLRSYGTFYGTTDGKKVDDYCLNVSNPGNPSDLVLKTKTGNNCEKGTYDNKWTFLPDPTVGAGFAGAEQNEFGKGNPAVARQLVSVGNEQFGRCLDIAGAYNPPTYEYMIAWPCKQSPDPALTAWNQMWTLPAIAAGATTGTGLIRSYVSDTAKGAYYGKYLCLKSSGSTAVAPFVQECPTGNETAADLQWTVSAKTGIYATSYQVKENTVANSNLCLSPAGPNPLASELYSAAGYAGPPVSKVLLRTCDGSQWQKWNAPPDINDPPRITDYTE